jgi:hypothetical protein
MQDTNDAQKLPDPQHEWLDDFAASARSTSAQIGLVVDELVRAVGDTHFPVVAPIVLQQVIDTSAEMANLLAGNRQAQRAAAQRMQAHQAANLAAVARPGDPAWAVRPYPMPGLPKTADPFDFTEFQ